MEAQPDEKPAPAQLVILHYATPIDPEPIQPQRPAGIVWLIGITALVSIWSLIVGVFYLIDIWFLGAAMATAAVFSIWATLGKLSAKRLRLAPAALLLALAAAIDVGIVLLTHPIVKEFERDNAATPRAMSHAEVIEWISALSAVLCGFVLLYLIAAMLRRWTSMSSMGERMD